MAKLEEYWINRIKDIYEFKYIACSEQPEVDDISINVKKFPREIIVDEASGTGLGRYEKMLGLREKDLLEARRRYIKQNLNNSMPFTKRYLINLLDNVVGSGAYYLQIIGYRVDVGIIETHKYLINSVREDLRKKIPANMGLNLYVLESINQTLYTGFYIRTTKTINV